jgi:hypothetical protein
MVAKLRRTSAYAGTEAELLVGDEGCPFVVLLTNTEAVAIHETANYMRK